MKYGDLITDFIDYVIVILSQVAIIIPFRNRHFHLPILLRYLVPMLQKQQLEFSIFVINQVQSILYFYEGKQKQLGCNVGLLS